MSSIENMQVFFFVDSSENETKPYLLHRGLCTSAEFSILKLKHVLMWQLCFGCNCINIVPPTWLFVISGIFRIL